MCVRVFDLIILLGVDRLDVVSERDSQSIAASSFLPVNCSKGDVLSADVLDATRFTPRAQNTMFFLSIIVPMVNGRSWKWHLTRFLSV